LGVFLNFPVKGPDYLGIVKPGLHQVEKPGKGRRRKGRKEEYRYKQAKGSFLGNIHYKL